MAKAPYYIIVTLKEQVLLNFLKVRVIVNDKDIYPLLNHEPVVIPVEKDNPKIVITDGYHFTKPLQLTYRQPGYFNFNVVCAIDNLQLLAAGLILAILYLLGFWTDFFFLKLLSFTPIAWMLAYYYINRKGFLKLTRVK